MLEVFTNLFSIASLYILGFITIKKIISSDVKLLKVETVVLIILCTILSTILHTMEYSSIYTISVFLSNILIYTYIFKENVKLITIASSIYMAFLFITEIIAMLIFTMFCTLQCIRENILIYLISNVFTIILFLVLFYITRKKLTSIYKSITKNITKLNIIFFIILIIGLTFLMFNVVKRLYIGTESIVNIIIMILLVCLAYIYYKSKESLNKITDEYDSLFNYVQTFEDWIENEQLNRHEYKNQLAAIRMMTKDKNVIKKINSILEDNIKIKKTVIQQLKQVPNGGLKGLLYYKISIANKNNICLTVDTSLKKNNCLELLSEKEIKDLCRLIGIYFDNAIEATLETDNKNILVEIYELKDKVEFVISNTFKKHENFDNRNEKGVSSKGYGHGNGLYFAGKIVNKNKYITQSQTVIDDYYYQRLTINKKTINKR